MWNMLGCHAQVPSTALHDFVAEVKPGVVKIMFDGQPLRDLMAASPDSLFIYRHYSGESPHDFQRRCLTDPINVMAEQVYRIWHDLDIPQGVYIESENEWWGYDVVERSENGRWVGDVLLASVDVYLAHFAGQLTQSGYGVVLGNCGTGNIEGKWFRYLPNTLRTWLNGKGKVLWGWHEYGWPIIMSHKPYHALRHLRVIDEMVAEGLVTEEQSHRLWSVITEFGVTRLINSSGGDFGYQTLRPEETAGLTPAAHHWRATLEYYNSFSQTDPVLMGICHYMTGSEEGRGENFDWKTFDALRDPELLGYWKAYAAANQTFYPLAFLKDPAPPEPPPPEPPPPEPEEDMPPDRARYEPLARDIAAEVGINPDLFVAQITQESGWDPDVVSRSGAVGLGQLMPQWYPDVDHRDPEQNLRAAAQTMESHLLYWKGDYAKSLASYNGGRTAIQKWVNTYGADWRKALTLYPERWPVVAEYGTAAKAREVATYLNVILGPEEPVMPKPQPPSGIKWIGTPHKTAGRDGHRPVAIVDHIMEGTLAACDSWFNNRESQVSAHFGIGKQGQIHQYVGSDDTAWANGRANNPDLSIPWLADAIRRRINPNALTISIEHEGKTGDKFTEAQYQATLALHRYLVAHWGIRVDRHHIIGHNAIDSVNRARCPGSGFPWDRLMADLKGQPAPKEDPVPLDQYPAPSQLTQTDIDNTEHELGNIYERMRKLPEGPQKKQAELGTIAVKRALTGKP